MSEGYKGQLEQSSKARNKQKTIRLAGPNTDMMKELKKAISRVPFNSDYEIHMRFPGKLFFKNGGDKAHLRNNTTATQLKITARNPLWDQSPNQYYNENTIRYVENRLPFLTKGVSAYDQALKTEKVNILNREWNFGSAIDYGEVEVTFYDMYVQDKDGIEEWITVSEYFKIWMDNVLYNEFRDGAYRTYSTVNNYFDNYAIPKMEIMQFSRRLEYDDLAKLYGEGDFDKITKGNFSIIKLNLDKQNWSAYVDESFSKDHYLAGYLNELQKRRMFSTGIIGTIGSVFDIINNFINIIAVSSDIVGNFTKKNGSAVNDMEEFKEQMRVASKIMYNEYYTSFKAIAESYSGVPKGDYAGEDMTNDSTKVPDPKQLQYVIDYALNEENIRKISGNAIEKAIDGAKQDAEPKFFGIDTPIDEILSIMGFISTGYELYDLAKALVWTFKPPKKTSDEFRGSTGILDTGTNTILKTGTGIGKQFAQAVLGDRFITTDFIDNSVNATITFLQNNEFDLMSGITNTGEDGAVAFPNLFKFPLNFEALREIYDDGRYSKANIGSSEIEESLINKDKGFVFSMAEESIYVDPIKTTVFYDVYPIMISYDALDYDKGDEPTTFKVKFAYTHFDQK